MILEDIYPEIPENGLLLKDLNNSGIARYKRYIPFDSNQSVWDCYETDDLSYLRSGN